MPRGRKGFTLIELLVVIAIIAILAAILFPVFARARAKAQQNACLSNIKQLTLGLKMYMSDFDGRFPYAFPYTWYRGQWKIQLGPYVRNGQLFVCPADQVGENNTAADRMGSEDPENWQSSYGYNETVAKVTSPQEERVRRGFANHPFTSDHYSIFASACRNQGGLPRAGGRLFGFLSTVWPLSPPGVVRRTQSGPRWAANDLPEIG